MASDQTGKSPSKDPEPLSFVCDDQTYYQILKVSNQASLQEIKSAWRTLSAAYHPDKNDIDTTSQFQLLVEAYATLKDPECRSKYDEKLLTSSISATIVDRIPARMDIPTVCNRGKSVIVQWFVSKEEGTRIENFVLEFKQEGYNVQQAYEGKSTKVMLTGLTDDWIYQFRVLAVNGLGAGEHSEWTSHRTNFATPISSYSDASHPPQACTKTQEFINHLHFAISTRNAAMVEAMLEKCDSYDLHQFWDLIAFAIDSIHLQHQKSKNSADFFIVDDIHHHQPLLAQPHPVHDPQRQHSHQRCVQWDHEAPSHQHVLFQPSWPKSLL